MVEDYLDQIRKIQPSGPYHLLGWSFGGVLAFAIATKGEFAPPTERWRPYVNGQIDIHPIACRHRQMTQPGPIAEICRVLAIELEKRRTNLKSTND